MKTFEENLDAWLEGRLDEKETASFEASLPEISAAELEQQDEPKLSALLKQRLGPRPMANGEFFQHQLNQQIEHETLTTPPAIAERKTRESWWSIGRLVWTGAASLAVFCVCTFFVMREGNVGGQSTYLTQIINARVDPAVSPDATISMFESKEDKVTVLWVEGLQSLPSEYAAK
jgi:hypothetical protein